MEQFFVQIPTIISDITKGHNWQQQHVNESLVLLYIFLISRVTTLMSSTEQFT